MTDPTPTAGKALQARRKALGLRTAVNAAAALNIPVPTMRALESVPGRLEASALAGPLDRLLTYMERFGVLPLGPDKSA